MMEKHSGNESTRGSAAIAVPPSPSETGNPTRRPRAVSAAELGVPQQLAGLYGDRIPRAEPENRSKKG